MSRTIFDTTQNGADYQMTVNGLSVGLNMPEALKTSGTGETEFVHSLPPYRPRRAYLVDEYPACPASWLRSSGRIKSYFVPVLPDAGLWLDFNGCASHASNTAIVVSVQGVNAVTGLPCKDAQLEQYRDECPKHKKPFGPDRLCTECNFKWPKQNYLASTGTPYGSLWLDGFRAEDGKVRQYVFTEQKVRGVAKAIIGEDRVFALGISFFLSKEPKPPRTASPLRSFHGMSFAPGVDTEMLDMSAHDGLKGLCGDNVVTSWGASITNSCDMDLGSKSVMYSANLDDMKSEPPPVKIGAKKSMMKSTAGGSSGSNMMAKKSARTLSANFMSSTLSAPASAAPIQKLAAVKQLEVAAGARINQQVCDDPNDLEYWQKEPEGLIIINYCTQEDALKIIAAGKIDLSGHKDGFLQNVPKGNP